MFTRTVGGPRGAPAAPERLNIDQYEKEILAVDYINKIIETKDQWNQMNPLNMQSMLGANCRMPLLYMSKSYIWLEETNQRINEFSIGYMMNSTLYRNRAFKDQVKVCFTWSLKALFLNKSGFIIYPIYNSLIR